MPPSNITEDFVSPQARTDSTPSMWQKSSQTSAGERVEMVVCLANWIMFSNLLRTLEIPVEDGVMSWPPDGKMPAGA